MTGKTNSGRHQLRTAAIALVFLLVAQSALATWSVVAINMETGEVVIASATCVAQARFPRFPAKDLRDIQAIVVPGKAAAAAQAGVDSSRLNQQVIYHALINGTDPHEIIEMLKLDPAIERRQFGIVDAQGRHAGFSGAGNGQWSLHSTGVLEGEPIVYAIQGNILADEAVVHDAVAAFKSTGGSLADRVMAAMEAADANGGDSRCTCESQPIPDAPCDAKTAHVAYILKADAGDAPGAGFNDGDWSMYISVTDQDIQPHENGNPVKTLRMRYDAWKAGQ